MRQEVLQVIMAAVGTLGFSIYFRVSEKNVVASTVGGAIGWAVYLLIFHCCEDLFFSNFVASFVVYFWSVVMARVLKAPSNTYLIPGIIPLLPGNALYYTMSGIVNSDREMFTQNGINTVLVTFGMVAGTVFFHYVLKFNKKLGNRNSK